MAKGRHERKDSHEEKAQKIILVTAILSLAKVVYDIIKDILNG